MKKGGVITGLGVVKVEALRASPTRADKRERERERKRQREQRSQRYTPWKVLPALGRGHGGGRRGHVYSRPQRRTAQGQTSERRRG